jgi:hypothetical protein
MAAAMPLDLSADAPDLETTTNENQGQGGRTPVEKFFADRGIAPLDDEDLHVFPLGDLSQLPPEFRAGMEEGEADVLAGRVVTRAEVQRRVADMRLRRE